MPAEQSAHVIDLFDHTKHGAKLQNCAGKNPPTVGGDYPKSANSVGIPLLDAVALPRVAGQHHIHVGSSVLERLGCWQRLAAIAAPQPQKNPTEAGAVSTAFGDMSLFGPAGIERVSGDADPARTRVRHIDERRAGCQGDEASRANCTGQRPGSETVLMNFAIRNRDSVHSAVVARGNP